MSHEVIDVDEWDSDGICFTGVRHYVRIGLPPTPRKKRRRTPPTISLLDSDAEPESAPVASSSQTVLDQENSDINRPSQMSHIRAPSTTDYRTKLQNQAELALRRALDDARPIKRPATDAVKTAMNAIHRNNQDLKRKARVVRDGKEREIIDLRSDSEAEEGLPLKKPRVGDNARPESHAPTEEKLGSPSEALHMIIDDVPPELPSPLADDERAHDGDIDDDDDFIDFLASLDITNENNWVPLPESKKAEDLAPIYDPDADIPKHSPPTRRIPRRKQPVDYRHLPVDWCSWGPWGVIAKNYGIQRLPKPWYHARRQEQIRPLRTPNLYYEQGYNKLELTAKYPHLTSGSVNKIIQVQGTVVLGAVVEAGAPDYSDDEDDQPPPPPENKPGSLVVYRRGQVYVAQTHYRARSSTRGQILKYYTVNDVAFNPSNPAQFLSSGCDFTVQFWEVPDGDNGENECLRPMQTLDLEDIPHDLVYSPDGSLLAVSCHDGIIRLYNSRDLFVDMVDAPIRPKKFHAAPKNCGHATGATVWGSGSTKHLLFASSEPTEETDFGGYHHAFDVQKGVQAMQLDATESGDAAALSPDGTTLVLTTWGRDNIHPLRLYDVRRKNKVAYETDELEKFRSRPSAGSSQDLREIQEVNCASFSPDGILLAFARSDNTLHIYDVRALRKGPLCRFSHHDSDAVGGGGYGIVSAKWVEGRQRLGIITGGNDGCVRLWEPGLGGRGELQGMVLGRTDFDVGHFSVGDRRRGEFPLVIGDSGGGMHTYDFTNPDGVPL